jgi:esterase/lipase
MDEFLKSITNGLINAVGWTIGGLLTTLAWLLGNKMRSDKSTIERLTERISKVEEALHSHPSRPDMKEAIEDAKRECYSNYDNFTKMFENFSADMKDSIKDIRQDIKQIYERRNGNGHGG